MATPSKILPGSSRRVAADRAAHPRPAAEQAAARRRVVDFRGVSKLYAGDVGLDQATFSIDREEFVFLVGATGSGKSTLMRLLIKELTRPAARSASPATT